MHGGKTPHGTDLPQYKNGSHSRYLPQRMREDFERARDDPNLLSFREDLALVEARLADLLRRVDTGESSRLWFEARAAYRDLAAAIRAQDTATMGRSLAELEDKLGRGVSDASAWNEIGSLLERKRRIQESEIKRLVWIQGVMTAEQVMIMLDGIAAAVREDFPDRRQRAKVTAALDRYLSPAPAAPDKRG